MAHNLDDSNGLAGYLKSSPTTVIGHEQANTTAKEIEQSIMPVPNFPRTSEYPAEIELQDTDFQQYGTMNNMMAPDRSFEREQDRHGIYTSVPQQHFGQKPEISNFAGYHEEIYNPPLARWENQHWTEEPFHGLDQTASLVESSRRNREGRNREKGGGHVEKGKAKGKKTKKGGAASS